MEYLLYGTSLMAQVQNALSQSETPLSVRELAATITASVPEYNTPTLRKRIRFALSRLKDDGLVVNSGTSSTRNLSFHTYTTTDMSKIGDRLKNAMAGVNGATASGMLSMVKPMIPGLEAKFATHLQAMAQPVSDEEGSQGILKEGETHAGFWITQQDGKLVIAECALSYNKDLGKMVMSKPVAIRKLEDILSMQ